MGLFDFNRDGKTDFGEDLFGFGMLGLILGAAEEERQQKLADADNEIREQIEELENQKSDVEDRLSDLQDREPDDPSSHAYERWEEKCEVLEDLISDIDEKIMDFEETLED